ncbi:hypothetical protein M3Y95_01171300 [Aphelenchoides besseyi]|nr:hypothetical protein M3Y95_01171300 [Aphelenchoides besseyi]
MPSVVWEFFTKTAAGPKCVLCNDLRRRRDSSTKTMWVHLKLKHLDIYRRLRNPDSCRNPVATKSSEVHETVTEIKRPTLFDNSSMNNSISLWPDPTTVFAARMSSIAPVFSPLFYQNLCVPPTSSMTQNLALNNAIVEFYAQMLTKNGISYTPFSTTSFLNNPNKLESGQLDSNRSISPTSGHTQKCTACKTKSRMTCRKCKPNLCVPASQKH